MENTNNQNVFELAITLGKALKKDERLVRMDAARKAYEEDPTLKTLMTEYDVQQKAIQQVASAEDFDPQLLQSIQLLLRNPAARMLHRKFFQGHPHFQYIFQVRNRNLCHHCTFARNHQHKPFQLKLPDCFTDRCPAHPKLLCQMNFHQTLTRFQLSS